MTLMVNITIFMLFFINHNVNMKVLRQVNVYSLHVTYSESVRRVYVPQYVNNGRELHNSSNYNRLLHRQ